MTLSNAEFNAVSYFAIGIGSEGAVAGRDVSNRLSFAGNIRDGVMEPVGNSGLSIGTLQTDLGQHPDVAADLVAAYQTWAREHNPDWVLSAEQERQTVGDLSRTGKQIVADDGRPMDAVVDSRLNEFLRSDAGIRFVHDNDVAQADKLMREVYTPLQETDLFRNASDDDQVRLATIVAKAYNQSEVWGGRILDRIESGEYTSLADVSNGIGALRPRDDDYMQTGRDAALQGAEVMIALRNSSEDNPLHGAWQSVLAAGPLADPTALTGDPERPHLNHEYDTIKNLFLQKPDAPELIATMDRNGDAAHLRTFRNGDDGLHASGNDFVIWNRDGRGTAYIDGQWSEFDRSLMTRTENPDRTFDLSLDRNGQSVPLLRSDPSIIERSEVQDDRIPLGPANRGDREPRSNQDPQPDLQNREDLRVQPDRLHAPEQPIRLDQQHQLRGNHADSGERAQPILAAAAPDLDRSGPMLQAPPKRQELEMSPGERQLFERAMHLVQNKSGLTEEDAKKVATDVVLTARHTPGLSEKPEYMDVRNGHVMLAERVGKEPIFNGYVNIEQSRAQTQEQVHDKVAVQNQQRDQQQSQQVQHDSASLPDRRNPLAKIDDEVSARVMSSMPALKI